MFSELSLITLLCINLSVFCNSGHIDFKLNRLLGSPSKFRKDYSYFKDQHSFYKFHTLPLTWEEAKKTCYYEGAQLFYPVNQKEVDAVIDLWKRTQTYIESNFMWIGISDLFVKGVYETIDGKPISKVYNDWAPGEPNNANGGGFENCVSIENDKLQTNDVPCGGKRKFVCKIKSNTPGYTHLKSSDAYYKYHTDDKDWNEAIATCKSEGAQLFYPEDKAELQAVSYFWGKSIGRIFIGITDKFTEGVFETIDGKPASEQFNKWDIGEPNNYGNRQHCGVLSNRGTLDDEDCNFLIPFICKRDVDSVKSNRQCDVPDPKYFKWDGRCYKFHKTLMSWKDAYKVCALEQSYLAVMHGIEDKLQLINKLIKPEENVDKLHIGIYKKDDNWTTVGHPMKIVTNDILYGGLGNGECGSFHLNNTFYAIGCNEKAPFICEHDSHPVRLVKLF